MKITIKTIYEIESRGNTTVFVAHTSNHFTSKHELKLLFDLQAEQQGAVERKITKNYEDTVDTF
jgi:hypothetical protein